MVIERFSSISVNGTVSHSHRNSASSSPLSPPGRGVVGEGSSRDRFATRSNPLPRGEKELSVSVSFGGLLAMQAA
jgi:hypothetical protein